MIHNFKVTIATGDEAERTLMGSGCHEHFMEKMDVRRDSIPPDKTCGVFSFADIGEDGLIGVFATITPDKKTARMEVISIVGESTRDNPLCALMMRGIRDQITQQMEGKKGVMAEEVVKTFTPTQPRY